MLRFVRSAVEHIIPFVIRRSLGKRFGFSHIVFLFRIIQYERIRRLGVIRLRHRHRERFGLLAAFGSVPVSGNFLGRFLSFRRRGFFLFPRVRAFAVGFLRSRFAVPCILIGCFVRRRPIGRLGLGALFALFLGLFRLLFGNIGSVRRSLFGLLFLPPEKFPDLIRNFLDPISDCLEEAAEYALLFRFILRFVFRIERSGNRRFGRWRQAFLQGLPMPFQIVENNVENSFDVPFDCDRQSEIRSAVLQNVNRVFPYLTAASSQRIGKRRSLSVIRQKRIVRHRADIRLIFGKNRSKDLVEQKRDRITHIVARFGFVGRKFDTQNFFIPICALGNPVFIPLKQNLFRG